MASDRNPELHGLDQIIGLADNGNYHPDLLARNKALIAEMMDYSRAYGGAKAKGKLTLTIDYTIDRFGQIEISIEDKISHPKAPRAKAIGWTGEDGALTTANPNQKSFEIRDVTPGQREFRVPNL